MAHQYSRVGFKSSVEVNEVNLSLSYGGVFCNSNLRGDYHNPLQAKLVHTQKNNLRRLGKLAGSSLVITM